MEEARERFFSKVNKTDTCWLWIGTIVRGYGQFYLDNKGKKAHRVSWLLAGHTIPEGHLIRHKCRNRHCVNPEHLETGTSKDNVADMLRDGTRPDRTGEKSLGAKLTEDQVRAIRARSSENQRELGEEFGVGRDQIYKIIARRQWSYLE